MAEKGAAEQAVESQEEVVETDTTESTETVATEPTEEEKAAIAAELQKKEKKFTDEDMKKARESFQHETRKERDARIAAETEARVLRELHEKSAAATTETSVQTTEVAKASMPARPLEKNFETTEEFVAAMDKYDVDKYNYLREQERQADNARQTEERTKTTQSAIKQKVDAVIEEGRKKYQDYDDVVVNNPQARFFTPMLTVAITRMGNSADVAYHLSKSPEEGRKLAIMEDPIELALAVREISDKLKGEPPKAPAVPAAKTKAPAPAATVAAKAKASPTDTSLEGKSKEERMRLLEEAAKQRRLKK